MLQSMHCGGALLRGEVMVETGQGLAQLLGRRLARRLGLPVTDGRCAFEVRIAHQDGALLWQRRFGNGGELVSRFRPEGRFPRGSWLEQTGALELELGVDIAGGGWYWILRRLRWQGHALPRWLAPRLRAGKRIRDGAYEFEVAFSLPLLGPLLSYRGLLVPQMDAPAPAA